MRVWVSVVVGVVFAVAAGSPALAQIPPEWPAAARAVLGELEKGTAMAARPFKDESRLGWRLARKAMGFRGLMNVISADGDHLVKGSHGRITDDPRQGPLFISSEPALAGSGTLAATDVAELLLRHVFD